MQKLSMRKLSILGLVLMGASAVTAAVIPSKSDKKDAKKFDAGSLTAISESPNGTAAASSVTCEVDTEGTIGQACNISAASATTEGLAITSNNDPSSNAGGANEGNGAGNSTSADS